jgi:hypothetical protein
MRDARAENEGRWLLPPPEPGETRISIATGEGVELSAEARRAIDVLLAEMRSGDVTGFARLGVVPCPWLDDCSQYSCTLDRCQPQYRRPCFAEFGCKIAPEVR